MVHREEKFDEIDPKVISQNTVKLGQFLNFHCSHFVEIPVPGDVS